MIGQMVPSSPDFIIINSQRPAALLVYLTISNRSSCLERKIFSNKKSKNQLQVCNLEALFLIYCNN